MLWTGASVVPWVSLPDKRRPRRQVQGGINQAFCCLDIQTPRQHHPRRSGCDEDRKGLAMVLYGSRRRRRAGWGAELVAVAVPLCGYAASLCPKREPKQRGSTALQEAVRDCTHFDGVLASVNRFDSNRFTWNLSKSRPHPETGTPWQPS